MNNEQQKVIEIHRILNMHEANPEDTHLLMPNPFNTILTPHPQMPGRWSVHFVSICLMMRLRYRLPLLWHRSLTWALTSWYWWCWRSCCGGSLFQSQYCLILNSMWLWGLYYGSLGIHSKPGKLYFDTCKSLFKFLVVGSHGLVDEVLIVEGLLEVPIYACEVGV